MVPKGLRGTFKFFSVIAALAYGFVLYLGLAAHAWGIAIFALVILLVTIMNYRAMDALDQAEERVRLKKEGR